MKKIIVVIVVAIISGCGVKGKPLPPQSTPYIGRGEKVYSAVDETKKEELATTYSNTKKNASATVMTTVTTTTLPQIEKTTNPSSSAPVKVNQ